MSRVKPDPYLKELNLLYVEDEASIREPFEMILGRYFKKVYVGTNGAEGVELFKTNDIDLVISDIKMPIMTGLEMAKEIKEINYEVPLIFTTAFGDSDYLKSAIEVGADGYIIKPIDRNKVFERLNFIAKSLKAKHEVLEYLKLIETLFNYQSDALILLDKNLKIKIYNKTFKAILKDLEIGEIDSIEDFMKSCKKEDNSEILLDDIINNIENKIVCKNIHNKYFEIGIKKIENYILLILDDITEYKLENEAMKETAFRDQLTGLYNRQKLNSIKDKFIDNNLCLIMFDVDNFKKINDTYGHLKGDEVLKALSKTVIDNVRGSDIVVRWGGEEFIVVLNGLKDINIAQNLAEKLRQKINEIDIDEVGNFSCSFGVSCGFIKNSSDVENLLNKADEALYKAKREGKNRVEVFT